MKNLNIKRVCVTFMLKKTLIFFHKLKLLKIGTNYFGSHFGSQLYSVKTKTLVVKDLEGLRVVPPGLEPGTK